MHFVRKYLLMCEEVKVMQLLGSDNS